MNDENAFGVLLSWADVEQEEYTLELRTRDRERKLLTKKKTPSCG